MNLHSTTTKFNCGVDLHTRNMYVCLMDAAGDVLLHRKVRDNDMDYLRTILDPWIGDLTLCCESTCNWYILHEFCLKHGVEFVLGHALYIRAVSQAKKKNDHQDSFMLANLLRTNLLPKGFALPPKLRQIRDLLRRRHSLVQMRTSLKASLTMSTHMHGYRKLSAQDKRETNRRKQICDRASNDQLVLEGFEAYLKIIESLDEQIHDLLGKVEAHCSDVGLSRPYQIIRSFPGIGELSALTILFEMGTVSRFPSAKDLLSYTRIATPEGESDGKKTGRRNRKIGNQYLCWAFNQVVVHARRTNPMIAREFNAIEKLHGSRKARNILAGRYVRSVYCALKNDSEFSMNRFLQLQHANEESTQ